MTLRLGGDGAITGCTSLENPDLTVSGLTISGSFDAEKVLVASGTAAAPSYTFSGDTDNGLYYAGTNSIGVSTAGTSAIVVDASQQVGIGTSSPRSLLSLGGATATATATPATLDLGGTYSNSAGTNLKLRIFYDGTSSAGFGLSANQLDYTAIASNSHVFYAGTSELMRLDGSGNVGIGNTSPGYRLDVKSPGNGQFFINGQNSSGNNIFQVYESSTGDGQNGILYLFDGAGNNDVKLSTNGNSWFNGGNLGIGTTSPSAELHVNPGSGNPGNIRIDYGTGSYTDGYLNIEVGSGGVLYETVKSGGLAHVWYNTGAERMRIDSSGRLLVGATSEAGNALMNVRGNTGSSAGVGVLNVGIGSTRPTGSGSGIGYIRFTSTSNTSSNYHYASINCETDGASSSDTDIPGRLLFSTTADGASSPTERMRITSSGDVTTTGSSTFNRSNGGFTARSGDSVSITRVGGTPLEVNRQGSDGTLVTFFESSTAEGTISVSGGTVSYNGAHLSRWSQLPGGAARTEILRGTVLSNLDEMCEWGDEDNEQLNRMQVSNVEGDRNVAGVFQCWDDDDDTYTNDFYCAMTGDFIIRIAQGTTVARGDLLMSAGDGTAKPQDDDIIRSKTIAKVTSTVVSETYSDGSYCVPCVLMAC